MKLIDETMTQSPAGENLRQQQGTDRQTNCDVPNISVRLRGAVVLYNRVTLCSLPEQIIIS